ncbi:MAG: cupin domain-containing protein [Alphaproteobacteria bacterium]
MPSTRTGGARAFRARRLAPRHRAVFDLGDDLLLVFKPQGHAEEPHRHPHGQELRVLRGRLVVETPGRTRRLGPASPALRLRARVLHATRALDDTWLVVERRRVPREARA